MLPLTRSRNRARFFGIPFSPSTLFQGGTVAGAWYDPSDLTTMVTTSAGTTPVSMPGQGAAVPVGLMLDKSQGLVLGPELVNLAALPTPTITNSGGSVGVWDAATRTMSNTGSAASSHPRFAFALGLVVGRTYFVTGVLSGSLTQINPSAGIRLAASGSANTVPYNSATGVFSGYAVAAATNLEIVTELDGAESLTISSLSVRELPGNHAIAFNNTTARPELRARVNLLVATATLSTQSVTTQATSYTLSFAGAGSITLSGTATGSYSAGTHTITCTAGTLTLTVSGTVTTADLRPANSGALLPAYQAVVDANTYDTSGFPLYLYFDGIDDSMYTPANLNLSATDKVAVFAGVRKLSDAAAGVVTEFSATATTNNGAFRLLAPDGATPSYGFLSKGTSGVEAKILSGFAAPISNTTTGIGDIGAPSIALRINGAQVAANSTSQGTGNYGTYPLYIGARNNASLWFNGHLHSLIIAGSAVSAGNISATEQWVAQRTGLALP